MAIKIKFDSSHNAQLPTFVLGTRSGRLLGKLPIGSPTFRDAFNGESSAVFSVYKNDCVFNGAKSKLSVTPISLHNVASSISGRTRVGDLTLKNSSEIKNYFSAPEQISDLVLKFTFDNQKKEYYQNELSYEYDSENETFTIAYDNTELIYVDSDGHVYINNIGDVGVDLDESYFVTLSFNVPEKSNVTDFWDLIKDFKLVWAKEWNRWFEAAVEISESDSTRKNVTLTSLGEAELSQINLYDIEINTEDDIDRDDYVVTTLFNETNHKASLLHRILEKAPHYVINHVDSSIANIQRTFSFDNQSIYDAFNDIAEEIGCLFCLDCYTNSSGKLVREINVYDLETVCNDCGHRGEFSDVCEKCGSTNLKSGYGEDTTIFISVENLAEEINFSTDNCSVKNCFRLEAGDDLMSATIANCNPNGSRYLWYISDEVKSDMSDELVEKLEQYNKLYAYYQGEHEIEVDSELRESYNALVQKYREYSTTYSEIPETIIGFPALMQAYYDAIDFYLYLNNSLMPSVEIQRTTAGLQAAELNTLNLSPVAVQNLENCSVSTATSAVLSMAKTIVDPRYQVKVKESQFENATWVGIFTVTNYSDEEDTETTLPVTVYIDDNYEKFVKQKIDIILNRQSEDITDIVGLFKLGLADFKEELKKYSLVQLRQFGDACQSCIDILIEQGIADRETWANSNPDMYGEVYLQYYNKLQAINDEIVVREAEIAIIVGKYNVDGELESVGIQTFLSETRTSIQTALNFEKYLGTDLWLKFVPYRRESTYQNKNYISDGLDNSEIIRTALNFIDVASKEIYKSATLQHSISATLNNLLVMKEFEPLLDKFEVGNWIRVRVDGRVYKLRLLEYEINFDDLQQLDIEFSDVVEAHNSVTDIESVLKQASSMATSYDSVVRQANSGEKANAEVSNWVKDGLALTQMKIVNSADNQNITWNNHGLLCREYLPITDSYDDRQLKIINRGLYLTDDNWLTSRAAIGNFIYYDPFEEEEKEGYGVIADTLVSNLILSEDVGIYGSGLKVRINQDGLKITNNSTDVVINPNDATGIFTIQNHVGQIIDKIFYVDSNGVLHIKGDGAGLDISSNTSILAYDTEDYDIAIFGYGAPDSTVYPPANYSEREYLDQDNGYVYISTGIEWVRAQRDGSYVVLQQKTVDLQTQISQNAHEITTKVSSTDYNGNSVVSMINQSATTISISASKIDLTGYVTVTDLGASGSTIINGNRISGGTISLGGANNGNGVIRIYNDSGTEIGSWTKDGINAASGTFGGTVSGAAITGGTITGSAINIGSDGNGGYNFSVNSNGNLIAKTGTFYGALNGCTGTFTGSIEWQKTGGINAEISFTNGSSYDPSTQQEITTDLIQLYSNRGILLHAEENIGIRSQTIWFQGLDATKLFLRKDNGDSGFVSLKNYIKGIINGTYS